MDSSGVLIIEASAGSGKTYRLTLQFLVKLLLLTRKFLKTGGLGLNREIANILAITFTNKAANEMKERIIEQLKDFALIEGTPRNPMLEVVSRETGMDKEEIQKYSVLILDSIISHLGDFNVKTIDSLMSSIIKVISPDLNLAPGIEVSIDSSRELNRLVSEYIDICSDRRWTEVEKVLQMLKELGQLNNWRPDQKIGDKLKEFFHQYMKSEEEDFFSPVKDKDYRSLRHSKLLSIGVLLEKMGKVIEADKGSKSKFLDGNKVRKNLIDEFASFKIMPENLQVELIREKSFFKKSEAQELMSKKSVSEGNFTDKHEEFINLYSQIREEVEELFLVLSKERVAGYSELFRGFGEFWSINRKSIYVEEFSKTLKSRIEDWSREGCFPYIFLKLSERYRHFLFDEFQDTSRLQFRALSPVIEEVLTGEEESSLFIVGDRKQAIYRWRGGSSELMKGSVINREFLNSVSEEAFQNEVLEFNWRSRKVVVDFNNAFWSEGFGGTIGENFDTVFQKIPEAKGESDEGGYVNVKILEKPEAGEAADPLAQEVFRMVEWAVAKGYGYSDIAILTRKKSRGRELIQYLSSKGVKGISDESLFLSSSQVLKEIIAFLRFLELPTSDLIFNEFLNGVVLEKVVNPGELIKLREFTCSLCKRDRKKSIFSLFSELFPDIKREFIDPFLNATGLVPVYDLFNDITRVFGVFENHPQETPFILTFGEYLHTIETEGITSVSSFLWEWDSSDSSGPSTSVDVTVDNDSVRVMTLHKSKGLEFPVVIMPVKDEKDLVDNIFIKDGELYYISRQYAELNGKLETIYREENLKRYIDELNLLYVGFTRAVDMLLIPVMKPSKQKGGSLGGERFRGFASEILENPLIKKALEDGEGDCVVLGEPAEKRELLVTEDKEVLNIPPKYFGTAGWQKKMLVYAASDYEVEENRESILRGERMHQMFANIGSYQSREEFTDILNKEFEDYKLRKDEKDKYLGFFTKPEVMKFYVNGWKVFNEIDIAHTTDEGLVMRRVDRLMVNGNELVVIDYKTGSSEKDEYSDQIREYGKLGKEVWGAQKVYLYLLYPDIQLIKEVKWLK